MKRRSKSIIATAIAVVTLAATTFPASAAQVGSDPAWFDEDRKLSVGNGLVFSYVRPEITDPEYYIRERYMYPGEQGNIPIGKWAFDTIEHKAFKTPYESEYADTGMKEALPLLQEFVHSFDWINSDERTRYEKVYERLGNNYSGNIYGSPTDYSNWTLLKNKIGVCQQYADEFAELCRIVGLDCVSYIDPDVENHESCLIKIDGQWYKVDTTNWPKEKTVVVDDYDTEYNRFANEVNNSQWYQDQMQQVEWQRQAEAGEITWIEYYQRIYPGKTNDEIEKITGINDPSHAEYYHDLESYQKFMDSFR